MVERVSYTCYHSFGRRGILEAFREARNFGIASSLSVFLSRQLSSPLLRTTSNHGQSVTPKLIG
jgi:hypothetical protein